MHVKISYSVPFDEVEKRVDDLIFEKASEMVSLSTKVSSKQDILSRLQTIEEARRKLITIDLVLQDCYNILASYNKALASMHGEEQGVEDEDVELISDGRSGDDTTKSSAI